MSARSQISHPQSVILVGRIPSAARKALVQVSLGNPLLSADIMNAPGLAVQNYSPGATLFSALLLCLSTRGIQNVVYLQMPALQSGVLLVSMSCYKGFFFLLFFLLWRETTNTAVRTLLYNDLQEADAFLHGEIQRSAELEEIFFYLQCDLDEIRTKRLVQ